MKKLLTILCFLILLSACSANNSVADKSEEKETNETVEKTEDLNAAKASPFVDLAGINSDNFAEYVNGKYYACKTYDESNNYNGNFAKEFCVFKFNIDGDNLLFEKYDYTNLKPVVFELDKNSEFAEFSRRYGQFTYHYHYLRSYNDEFAVNNIAVYLPTDAESDEVGGLYFRYENDILSFNFKT